MKIGYFLSSEELGPKELVRRATDAQQAGFEGLWISDHFHPWLDAQGHSPFVWSVIGAIAQAAPGMHVSTAVTCPTTRVHPVIVAQAAATASLLLDGRFTLGVGTGEALNEHIFGDRWPEAAMRREQLEEAVAVIRDLWSGGFKSHHGRHYQVENARIYDLPADPPQIVVSGFGPAAIDLAAKIGDGFATVVPDGEAVSRFRGATQRETVVQGGLKVCFDSDAARARRTAHELWPNDALPGELAQILPTPAHFEQAAQLVDEDTIVNQTTCGSDIDQHLAAIRAYEQAGFDELYIQQIGPNAEEFFSAYRDLILPHFTQSSTELPAAGRMTL